MFQSIKQKSKRIFKPVIFNDFRNVKPISTKFGFDRGKPIDRYYIEKFLNENKRYIHGEILEIAENTYSKKFCKEDSNNKFNILTFDESDKRENIIFGDLTKIKTLPNNKINCFICTQTFNFIFDIKKAIEGAFYLLQENGVLLATVSGIAQISRYDMDRWGDYWRFTDLSAKYLFGNIFGKENVYVYVYGNVIAAISILQGIAIEDLPDYRLLDEHDVNYPVTIGIVARKELK